LGVEDWAEIRRLHRSARVSITDRTSAGDLAEHREGGAAQQRRASVCAPAGRVAGDGFEARVREWPQAAPTMPATVIAERIGWPYSTRTLPGR